MEEFYKCLFDEGEHTCFAASINDTKVFPLDKDVPGLAKFFCINPLNPAHDLAPVAPWHGPDIPRRADINCVSFRNFLIEGDFLPISEQINFIKDIKLPYSTAVFSGNKSVHFIVSLEQSEPSKDRYSFVSTALLKKINAIKRGSVDASTKNPSRLSRVPGIIRENGALQELLEVRTRIPNQQLYDWIGLSDIKEPSKFKKQEKGPWRGVLSSRATSILMFGSKPGQRNNDCFLVACELARAGYDIGEAYEKISRVIDLTQRELETTINQAYITALK